MRIAAIVANGSEDIELVVPVDLFRRAGLSVDLVTVDQKKTMTLQSGTRLVTDKTLATVNLIQYDALFLPGGMGHLAFKKAPRLLDALAKFIKDPRKRVFAICAAPSVLGEAGLLEGRKATGYPGTTDSFAASLAKDGVVTDGNLVTAQGPAFAFEFAMKCIASLQDNQKVAEVAMATLYDRLAPER